MRKLLALAVVVGLTGVAVAYDLGNLAPVKTPMSYPENIPNPERQGGDTIASATVIPSIPFNDTGTTVGYANDYEETCPYFSTSPEVVYSYVAGSTIDVDIDLCGSSYDTKVYVYDVAMTLIACNDDFYYGEPCGQYVSKLENVPFTAGGTYYIIVDGYGGASGAYVLAVTPAAGPCLLDCPAGGFPEGEPDPVDDYIDEYNSGCGGLTTPIQALSGDMNNALTLCGVSGWYTFEGSNYRDTDWFVVLMGPGGNIEVTGDAEYATYMFELAPQDCASVAVAQQITAGPCAPASMTITDYAYLAPVWFWAGPTVFAPPSGADTIYDYIVWFTGIGEDVVATESTTWGTVKALYD